MNSTFDKVMSWNRLERQVMMREISDLGLVVKDQMKRLDSFFRLNQIETHIENQGPALARVDTTGLSSALQCLLENAVIYNDSHHKQLWVTVTAQHSVAMISVRDNGPGIDPEDEPHLFERFFRGSQGKKQPGTGLGLNIAKTLIESQGGELRLVRPTIGGTQFDILFPSVKES